MRHVPTFDRHLVILLIAQAITGATGPILFLISGLLGPSLAPNLKISTLPMSLVVVGIAAASPLASFTMSRLGRKRGHLVGLSFTLTGLLVAGLALMQNNFAGYCAGCMIAGTGTGFNNQIRFTAAEGAGNQKALVHSWVLMFSLFAAFLGPWIAQYGRDVLNAGLYTGSIGIQLVLIFGVTMLMTALPKTPEIKEEVISKKITVPELLGQSRFWMGALSGTASFATMTLLMSATPLQMHEIEHFSHAETTTTIQSHIVAMFLPSLFSGILLTWLGIRKLIALGVGLFLLCIAITFFNSEFHHYWWALVLLGVGWNFLFLAGSTWVSQSFSGSERFVAQGANDTLVYGTQALASLAAGWLLFETGWKTLVLLPVPLLLGLLVFVWVKAPKK